MLSAIYPMVKFGDVVYLNTDRVPNPLMAGIERYVGLEHITPEDLHIHSWGLVAEGTTFTNYFKPGQVLFGKRRAYQRKVAVADFAGVCSSDIYVFESNDPEVLLPELLPFICQTEGFYQYAVGTSAGSLSPRTNWNQLANYEFPLPPLAEQRRIAELLWAVEKNRLAYIDLLGTEQILLSSIVEQECWINNTYTKGKLVSLVKNTTGTLLDGNWIESIDMSPQGIRLIQLADIGIGEFLNRSDRYVSRNTFNRLGCTEVLPNDILISRMADPTGRSCIIPDLDIPMITAVDCSILRLDPTEHNIQYWVYVLNSNTWFREIHKYIAGSTRGRISRKNLESIYIPIPSIGKQENIVKKLQAISNAITNTKGQLLRLYKIKQDIMTKMMFF